MKSTGILEQIQFNKQYYNEEYKEYGIFSYEISIIFNIVCDELFFDLII